MFCAREAKLAKESFAEEVASERRFSGQGCVNQHLIRVPQAWDLGQRRSELLGCGVEAWPLQVNRVENKHLKEACCPPMELLDLPILT